MYKTSILSFVDYYVFYVLVSFMKLQIQYLAKIIKLVVIVTMVVFVTQVWVLAWWRPAVSSCSTQAPCSPGAHTISSTACTRSSLGNNAGMEQSTVRTFGIAPSISRKRENTFRITPWMARMRENTIRMIFISCRYFCCYFWSLLFFPLKRLRCRGITNPKWSRIRYRTVDKKRKK